MFKRHLLPQRKSKRHFISLIVDLKIVLLSQTDKMCFSITFGKGKVIIQEQSKFTIATAKQIT